MPVSPGPLVGVGRPEKLLLLEAVTDELQADGHPIPVQTAGNADPRKPRQIYGDSINVAQIHLDRVDETLPKLRCRGRRHRPQDQVILLKRLVEGLLDQRLGPQGFQIIGVIIAAAEDKGTLVLSFGSWKAMASRIRAQSVTSFATGPIWSREEP